MKLTLEIQTHREDPTQVRTFESPSLSMGRNPKCDLSFNVEDSGDRVSWSHAIFELRDGDLFIRDLDSRNGTYVNDEPVLERQVRIGDCVRLAKRGPRIKVLAFEDEALGVVGKAAAPALASGRHASYEAEVAAARSHVPPELLEDEPRTGWERLAERLYDHFARRSRRSGPRRSRLGLFVTTAFMACGVAAILWLLLHRTDAQQVYPRLLHGTVLIINRPGMAMGSGTLVDAERRLVVTAAHIVDGADEVEIYTPLFEDGEPVTLESAYHEKIQSRSGLKARVIARDERRDLAILELPALWEGAAAIPLATRSAAPGQDVHALGNPRVAGLFWVYTAGEVRDVRPQEWTVEGRHRLFHHEARILETTSPVNDGDGGGPLVNDNGELVGITQNHKPKGILSSWFIDVSDIAAMLHSDS